MSELITTCTLLARRLCSRPFCNPVQEFRSLLNCKHTRPWNSLASPREGSLRARDQTSRRLDASTRWVVIQGGEDTQRRERSVLDNCCCSVDGLAVLFFRARRNRVRVPMVHNKKLHFRVIGGRDPWKFCWRFWRAVPFRNLLSNGSCDWQTPHVTGLVTR